VREVDFTAPIAGRHSAVVAFNVLEHIEDDVGALRGAQALLRPGGLVVMLTPAFELAMSRFDREIGHYRRYSKCTLRAAYESAGLTLERLEYVNAPGCWAGSSR
jgi:2-polyprenyl-3-methyl-5-hydroxy-6-metoxy-1,4-benzoquinol methylase